MVNPGTIRRPHLNRGIANKLNFATQCGRFWGKRRQAWLNAALPQVINLPIVNHEPGKVCRGYQGATSRLSRRMKQPIRSTFLFA
jgi:hypothetical protein